MIDHVFDVGELWHDSYAIIMLLPNVCPYLEVHGREVKERARTMVSMCFCE